MCFWLSQFKTQVNREPANRVLDLRMIFDKETEDSTRGTLFTWLFLGTVDLMRARKTGFQCDMLFYNL